MSSPPVPPVRDQRPEGAYVSSEIDGGVRLYHVERVNGDDSVTSIWFTQDEAIVVIAGLFSEAAKGPL
jgi:hypothetical protein